jgi:homocysteine S-methyltransferase
MWHSSGSAKVPQLFSDRKEKQMTVPLPGGPAFVTDGGLETDLIFNHGFDLPHFAAFPLLEDDRGMGALDAYYRGYGAIAQAAGAGLVLSAPTWRANPAWGALLGYDVPGLDRINRAAISFIASVRGSMTEVDNVVLAGTIGPRGDGYRVGEIPDLDEAETYQRDQIESFGAAGADVVEALTLTNINEAGGIVRAANAIGLPVGILFTVETDGRLPDGTPLEDAIRQVDAVGEVAYFGVNCAYPDHILAGLSEGKWTDRIAEVRPNASSKSHAELDEAEDLDQGDQVALANGVDELRARLANLRVVGGCCGTDQRHVARLWNIAQGS